MKTTRTLLATLLASVLTGSALAADELVIESWRNDDIDIWNDTIIPAFNAQHPDIQVVFKPTPPADYNASLNAKLAGGTAGDLITCRPFDASLDLYNKGHLIGLNELDGLANFSEVAKSAWLPRGRSVSAAISMILIMRRPPSTRTRTPMALSGRLTRN